MWTAQFGQPKKYIENSEQQKDCNENLASDNKKI